MSNTFNSRYFTTPPAYNTHFIYYLIFYYFIFSIIAYVYEEIKKNVNPGSWSNIPLTLYLIIIGFYIIISFSYNILKDVLIGIQYFNLSIYLIIFILIITFLGLNSKSYTKKNKKTNKDDFKRDINRLAWSILGLFCASLLITIGYIFYIIAKKKNSGCTLLFFTSFFNMFILFFIYIIYSFKNSFYPDIFSIYEEIIKAMKYVFYLLLGTHLCSLICAFLNNEYADLSYIIINSYNYIIYWYILLSVLFIIADTIDAVTNDKSITLWILTCLLLCIILIFFISQSSNIEDPNRLFELALNYRFMYANESI